MPAAPEALVAEAAETATPPEVQPATSLPAPPAETSAALAVAPPPSRAKPSWKRLLPLILIATGLLVAVVHDTFFREADEQPLPEIDYANPLLDLRFHEAVLPGDYLSRPSMRFGLGMPDPADKKKFKTKLIYDEHGRTCNVCVRIDSKFEYLWGVEDGAWRGPVYEPLGFDQERKNKLIGAKATWARTSPAVSITQIVEIVPGGLSADGSRRLLDTCLVRYDIVNEDSTSGHSVGLRFMLDTYIGNNDAVPFTIAGSPELCNTMKEFNTPASVPDFVSALEHQDVQNPGTVAHLSLKYGGILEPPSRVTLGAWPASSLKDDRGVRLPNANIQNTKWEVPVRPMAEAKSAQNPDGDSAVVLYWEDKMIAPKATRTVGFAYGLGQVSGDKGQGTLGIIAGGDLVKGKEFSLIAYVKNPAPGINVTLSLPPGLQLVGGELKQAVPALPAGAASPYSPVTWRVKANRDGVQPVKVTLDGGLSLRHRLAIKPSEITK
jgi:hypothetical protein